MKHLAILATGVAILTACLSQRETVYYGIQNQHRSFIPARTAVLPCQRWPLSARFEDLTLGNASKNEVADLCGKLDSYVIQGFKGQPFMRGLSPKAVRSSLNKAGKERFLANMLTSWQHLAEDCAECKSAPDFYAASIAPRKAWQSWLHKLSKNTYFADALLLPFVTYLQKTKIDDRGHLRSELQGKVDLLLIDTNSGSLVWAGSREAVASLKNIVGSLKAKKFPDYPSWEIFHNRIFQNDLWAEYPGLQNFLSNKKKIEKQKFTSFDEDSYGKQP